MFGPRLISFSRLLGYTKLRLKTLPWADFSFVPDCCGCAVKKTVKREKPSKENGAVTLKEVAKHVGLTPGTVSAVLNNSAASRSIPETTRQRILAAAREGIPIKFVPVQVIYKQGASKINPVVDTLRWVRWFNSSK